MSAIIVTWRDFFVLRIGFANVWNMSSSVFLELERRKLKMEWEQLPNPKPTWEDYKRLKLRITFK